MTSKLSINILYLCRATDDEIFNDMAINRFIASFKNQRYTTNNYQISLSILLKSPDLLPQLTTLTDTIENCKIFDMPDRGFDLGSYFEFANNCDSDFILPMSFTSFFTYSYSLSYFLVLLAEKPQLDLIFSQFSCTSFKKKLPYAFKLFHEVGLIATFKYILISFVFYIKYFSFPPFPNYHFRTTGFMIKRLLYCSYFNQIPFPESRYDCLSIESGKFSLFNFCLMHSSSSPYWLLDSDSYPIDNSDFGCLISNSQSSQLLVHDHRSFAKESFSKIEALRIKLITLQF